MKSVFLLWHTADDDDGKLIGVYDSRREAESAIERVKARSGFIDLPDAFAIDEYPLNKDHWVNGFVVE